MQQEKISSTSKRGFALLDAQKQREIARQGGQAAHRKGAAHEFSTDEAREAGRKGGLRISQDRAHMARIGSAGGKARRRPSDGQNGETSGDGQPHPGEA
jgi:general stress protein YciG